MLAQLAGFLVHSVMMLLMFAVGLRTSPHALRAMEHERALVARALLVLLVGVPLLALATVKLLPLDRISTAFILLVAVCPGAPFVLGRFRHSAVVVVIIAIVSALAPLTVSASVAILDRVFGFDLPIDSLAMLGITLKQLVPLATGMLIAAVVPRGAAALAHWVWYVFVVAFAIVAAIILYKGASGLANATIVQVAAVLVIAFGSAAMGHWAGGPRLEDRGAIATIAVLGNPALAIAVIAQMFPGFREGALGTGYLIARALALLPYTMWMKRRRPKPPRRVVFDVPPTAVTEH